MIKIRGFLLIGIDAEGDTRESNQASLDRATAIGRACSAEDEAEPPWQGWEVWGNHPETGEWMQVASSDDYKL
jgi:hypothetical protein